MGKVVGKTEKTWSPYHARNPIEMMSAKRQKLLEQQDREEAAAAAAAAVAVSASSQTGPSRHAGCSSGDAAAAAAPSETDGGVHLDFISISEVEPGTSSSSKVRYKPWFNMAAVVDAVPGTCAGACTCEALLRSAAGGLATCCPDTRTVMVHV